MTNVQLYFVMGVPTFSILVGIVVGIYLLNHMLNQINLRFTSLDNRMNSLENRLDLRMSTIESGIQIIVRIIGVLDTCIARLEERTAR